MLSSRSFFSLAHRISRPSTIFGGLMLGTLGSSLMLSNKAECITVPALDPHEFKLFRVREVQSITQSTKKLRFDLQSAYQELGLPVASCIIVRAPIGEEGKQVVRPYTPVSRNTQKGYFDLIVKVYDSGVMSKHLGSLSPGDSLEVKGPIPKIEYRPNMKKRIGMIAGGSGITPMYQVILEVLSNRDDKTDIYLLYANVSENDIILREELDDLARNHKNFHVYYTVDNPSEAWKMGSGYITREMIDRHMPEPSEDHLIMVCGPPGMMNHISGSKAPDFSQGELSGLLKDMNYTKNMVFKF